VKTNIPPRIIYKPAGLRILDQRVLPRKIKYISAENAHKTALAIKGMVLRGAPLIGCTAAYGYLLGIRKSKFRTRGELSLAMRKISSVLTNSRPTAIALFYAVERMNKSILKFTGGNRKERLTLRERNSIISILENEAKKMEREDITANYMISKFGASLLEKNSVILTHCNAGALATMGMGTAVGIITYASKKGKISHVYVSETRPYLQGARLTAWELYREKVPSTIICDNMAGYLMKNRKIDAVIVGADRIAANGDTANKIGTYQLSVLAKYHKIPFYVAAPTSTIDYNLPSGKEIKIEQRNSKEIIYINGSLITHKNASAIHPAFDITPRKLITAIITESRVFRKPNAEKLFQLKKFPATR